MARRTLVWPFESPKPNLCKDVRAVLEKIERGNEVIIEREVHCPLAVIKQQPPAGRKVSGCLALVDEQTASSRLTANPEEDLLGQTRCIYREDRLLLKGDVITVDGRAIRLSAVFLSSDEMPTSGS